MDMRTAIRSLLKLALGLLLVAAASASQAEELVVIVNAANPNASLTQQQVKAYFLKKNPSWANGEKVRPVDRDGDSSERTAMLKILGYNSDELKRYWIERQYANADQPPASVPDEASVLKFVSFFKGGIGFITKSGLAKAGGQGVKPVLTLAF
jgi:ABC-type phosphate transport system substrate-binding protein